MRISINFRLLSVGLLVAVGFISTSAWATTTKNCPVEPKQGVPIASGNTYFGSNCVLNTAADLDTFQFTAAVGDTWSAVVAFGSSPAIDICMTVLDPSTAIIFSGCTLAHNGQYATGITQTLTTAGVYTIELTEKSTAVQSYGLSLERLNPAPPDKVALTLGTPISGAITAPSSMNAFSFSGLTTGFYEVLASVLSGSAYNVCFQIYQPGGTVAVSGGPWCTFVHNGVLANSVNLTPPQNGTYVVLVYAGPRADELVGPSYGTVNYNLSASCLSGGCTIPTCQLKDAPTYDGTTGTLTMNFTLATPVAATWNAWLSSQNTVTPLFSVSQPITEPAITVTTTATVGKAGKVGVLSTLTTTKQGITCSNFALVNTGTP